MMTTAERMKAAQLPHWMQAPAWHLPDDDRIYGLDRLADWMGLPFLRVREMHILQHIPTHKDGRSIWASRKELEAHFLRLEAEQCVTAFIAPPDPARNAAADLARLNSGIAAHMGVTTGAVRHHKARNSLPVFRIGKSPFARRASLDLWAATGALSLSERRIINRQKGH